MPIARMPLQLVEVVLDLGRPPLARFPESEMALSDGLVTREDLDHATLQVSAFGADNRAGIDRTLHRVSCMRNRDGYIVGLTLRVGRAIPGSARLAADLIEAGNSILLLGEQWASCRVHSLSAAQSAPLLHAFIVTLVRVPACRCSVLQ